MNLFLCLVLHTANILGIFTDPFEFEGDYGPEVNPARQKVFELIVAKEALSRNLTDAQIRQLLQDNNVSDQAVKNYRDFLVIQAIKKDLDYGPTLSELVTPELIEEIAKKQQELDGRGFTLNDLDNIRYFVERYGDEKVFYFFRHNPPDLLSLDKKLRDHASRNGKSFDLPILGSTEILTGQNSLELKKDLLDAVFSQETLGLTKPEDTLKKSLKKLDKDFLQKIFGNKADNRDLEVFCSPAGQTFFYWAYHSLNLHLVSDNPGMIEEVNKVKSIFAHTIGDPEERARTFKEKLLAADSGVLFTQESDTFVPRALMKDGLFLPIDRQNPEDGCFIFLRSDLWESDYEMIPIENYEGFEEGRMVVILATRKETKDKFLLASCHGHSTKSEDGRLQISLVMEKFAQLSRQYPDLQLLIGIDANTKTEQDVRLLREHLDHLGLIATSVGPTTIKQRMVTAQHAKSGRIAIDEEDYLITLKGRFSLTHPTVGFKEEGPDINRPLPDVNNQSDHYPVGATLLP